ncbi:MAG: efflux RND transporter periplasmic adaptor subunit [Candidatus Moranbacteria bacterium]|nr:efflux RND transporter periplasmic adaptor subunit [Candidatus Moranbacteria bacterium]
MKRMRFVLISLVLAAVAVVLFVRSTKAEPESVSEVPTSAVRTETVSLTSFRPERSVSGFVAGVRQTDVTPKAGGYVVKLLKEEGDTVRSGEPIAVLDGSELSAMSRSAQLSLDAAQESLRDTKDFYDQKVDEAQASLDKAENEYASGNVSKADLDIVREAVKSAKRMRDAQNAAAAAGKAAAEGGVLVADVSAANATIKAPFSGVVTRRYVSLGSFVAPGMPVYSVSSTDMLEVNVPVPGGIAKDIRKGDSVSVVPEGTDTPVSGRIYSIAQAVGPTTQSSIARVRFEQSAVPTELIPGQYVTVSVPVGVPYDAIMIPESAIIHEYDDMFVFVLVDGHVTRTKVMLGEGADGRREIRSGLSSGAVIVTEGAYGLRDGGSVTVSE